MIPCIMPVLEGGVGDRSRRHRQALEDGDAAPALRDLASGSGGGGDGPGGGANADAGIVNAIDDPQIEETTHIRAKVGRYKRDTKTSINEPLWWLTVDFMDLTCAPLEHSLLAVHPQSKDRLDLAKDPLVISWATGNGKPRQPMRERPPTVQQHIGSTLFAALFAHGPRGPLDLPLERTSGPRLLVLLLQAFPREIPLCIGCL